MIKLLRLTAIAMGSIVVLAVGAPLLFWLGRAHGVAAPRESEDLGSNDPGVDVDEAR